jgi:hypothetical protein
MQALNLSRGPLANLGPALRACLAAGFDDGAGAEAPVESFAIEMDSIEREGMSAIGAKLLSSRDPELEATRLRFQTSAKVLAFRSLEADVAAGKVFARLADIGIPITIIKGPAIAPLHPAEWPRYYSDIDFMVPRSLFRIAIETCEASGFRYPETTLPPWKWFDVDCREGVNLHGDGGDGNVDIHHHVPPWQFGSSLSAEALIEASEWTTVAGARVRAVTPDHSLVIAGLHVLNDLWKNKRGIGSWRDIILLIQRSGIDHAATVFERYDLSWLFNLITASLSEAVPEVGILRTDSGETPRLSYRMRLALLGWNGPTAFSSYPGAWAARLPVVKAGMFLLGSAIPEPGYIRIRHGSYRSYWQQAGEEAREAMREFGEGGVDRPA